MSQDKPFSFAWFSSGVDEAAVNLLRTASSAMMSGLVPGRIGYAFVDRPRGESTEVNNFYSAVEELGITLVKIPKEGFDVALRERANRERFDRMTAKAQEDGGFRSDVVVLAGYMRIVSKWGCQKHTMINLHPALPGGPRGRWDQVVEQLIERNAKESGVQVHRVTPEVDRGPALSYCRFEIPQVEDADEKRRVIRDFMERYELPLLVLTLQILARKEIHVEEYNIREQSPPAVDLTGEVGV